MTTQKSGYDEIEEELVTHRRLADQEERERFGSFLMTTAVGSFAMAAALLLLKGWLPSATAALFGLLQLGIRHVGVKQKSNTLLRWLNHAVLTGYLIFIVAVSMVTGQSQSFALWFLVLLPIMAAFVNNPPTAGLWISIATLSAIGVWASEFYVIFEERLFTTPSLRMSTRIILILVVGAFAVNARRTSDHRVRELAHSLRAASESKQHALLLGEAAEKAKQAADSANESKSKILTYMSHEIRTPLNGVIGLNTLLQSTPLNEQQQEYVELARQSGEVLLSLINDFLDFSKLEANRLELESLVFDPCQLMEDKALILRETARLKGLTLSRDCSAPRGARGDRNRVGQILMNFVGNAVKFTTKGGITLRCREIDSVSSRLWLRFEIEDTGIGISPEAQERIFLPFMQADSSTTRNFGGTGLGLAICKSLVDVMGGRIGVLSREGEGSLFWAELPFDRVPQSEWPTAGDNKAQEIPTQNQPAHAGRILLVEDNPVSQLMASEMLRRLGHQVEVAANGTEAVEATRVLRFDLILMDCNMPVMDGLQATQVIRAEEPAGQHVPIVAMTASVIRGDRESCLRAGMDDFLAKPIRLTDLSRMIGKWMDHQTP